jgi:squalene cyclase
MQAAVEAILLLKQLLVDRQSPQGGWPFIPGCVQPSLEPTCLASLALRSGDNPARERAIHFLLGMQNPNGSWPAFAGDDTDGCGFTGLALYALLRCGITGHATERPLRWLLNLRGWESHWLWKWKFRTTDRHVRFDPDKFGWPWTPETVSWVVPTSYALLALKHLPGASQADLIRFRIQRGVEMLFDRACPSGGWNAGNGVVYGEPMTPHLDATALALLALRSEPTHELVTASLDWLLQRAQTCFAPWSLAWTILALDAYDRPAEQLLARLAGMSDPAHIRDSATIAVVSLAFDCALHRNVFKVTT